MLLDALWNAVNRKTKRLVGFHVGIEVLRVLRIFVKTFLTLMLDFMLLINIQFMTSFQGINVLSVKHILTL